MAKEVVNHPAHYNVGKIEVIDAIEDWQLGFHLGNAGGPLLDMSGCLSGISSR